MKKLKWIIEISILSLGYWLIIHYSNIQTGLGVGILIATTRLIDHK